MDISHIRIAISLFIICIIFYLRNYMKRKYYSNKNNKARLIIKSSNKITNQCNNSIQKKTIDEAVTHKEILLKLHEATDVRHFKNFFALLLPKCYMKVYALRCIQLVNYCPHLINIPYGLDGYTPFHRVCLRGNTCLIEYMLAKGANPFLTTYTGENAMCAALYYFLNHPNNKDFTILNILCEAGCYLNTYDIYYDIFMKAALNTNNKALVEWIVLNNETIKPLRSYSEPRHPICYIF